MWRDIAQHKSSAISDTRQHRAFSSQQTTLWPPCVATHAANSRSVSTNPDRQAHTDTDLLQCPVGSQPSRRARCQTPSRPGSGQQHPTAKHHRFDPCHSKQTRYLQRLGRRTRSKRPVRAHCNARLTVLCCAVLRCVVWCGVVWWHIAAGHIFGPLSLSPLQPDSFVSPVTRQGVCLMGRHVGEFVKSMPTGMMGAHSF